VRRNINNLTTNISAIPVHTFQFSRLSSRPSREVSSPPAPWCPEVSGPRHSCTPKHNIVQKYLKIRIQRRFGSGTFDPGSGFLFFFFILNRNRDIRTLPQNATTDRHNLPFLYKELVSISLRPLLWKVFPFCGFRIPNPIRIMGFEKRGSGFVQLLTKKDHTIFTPNNLRFGPNKQTCRFRPWFYLNIYKDLNPAESMSKSRSITDPFQAKTSKFFFCLKRIRYGSRIGYAFRRIQIQVLKGTETC